MGVINSHNYSLTNCFIELTVHNLGGYRIDKGATAVIKQGIDKNRHAYKYHCWINSTCYAWDI